MDRYILTLLMGYVLAGCAAYTATSGQVVIRDENTAIDVRIDNHDRAVIEEYYKKSVKPKQGLPPGLAKRDGNLPPGLAKRDKLPPGLQGEALPYDLEKKLAKLPSAYVRIRVGRDIVLLESKTRVVFDVVYGVGN